MSTIGTIHGRHPEADLEGTTVALQGHTHRVTVTASLELRDEIARRADGLAVHTRDDVRAMELARGTRAVQMAVGLGSVALLYQLSS